MQTIFLDSINKTPKNYTGIIEWSNGSKIWYKEGQLHREDGPAVESPNGTKQWFKDGLLHREDGPAVELINGNKYWYLEGETLFDYDVSILSNIIILDIIEHPKYPLLKIVKCFNKESLFEFCIIPGMRLHSKI